MYGTFLIKKILKIFVNSVLTSESKSAKVFTQKGNNPEHIIIKKKNAKIKKKKRVGMEAVNLLKCVTA